MIIDHRKLTIPFQIQINILILLYEKIWAFQAQNKIA